MKDGSDLRIRGGATINESEIVQTERILGRVLPKSFRSIVQRFDGGSPEVGVFEFADNQTAISEFLSFTTRTDDNSNVVYTKGSLGSLPAILIPFARDAGGWLICFDYQGSGEPSVVIFDPNTSQIFNVTSSFDAFLDALHE